VSMGLSPKERKRIKKEMKKIVGGPWKNQKGGIK
jgi:hypothetical protein